MRNKTDKIFDNNFESGDFELNGDISFNINSQYIDDRPEEEKIHTEYLRKLMHSLIEESRFKHFNNIDDFGASTKLRKIDINQIYEYLEDELSTKYSRIEIFAETADYFNIHPTKFYNSLSNVFKERLIEELDKKTNVLNRKNIKKLF
jgi:hypothetical protein